MLAPLALVASAVPGAVADQPDELAASEGGAFVNERVVFQAGELCTERTVFHYWGHERTLLVEDGVATPVTDPEFVPQAGDRVTGESADSQLTLKATRSGRKVYRRADGEFYGRVSRDGADVRVTGVGANVC